MKSKCCVLCKVEFVPTSGRSLYCLLCRPLAHRQHANRSYQKHKIQGQERRRVYYRNHRSEMLAQMKCWTEQNRDQKRAINSRAEAKRRGAERVGNVTKQDLNRIFLVYEERCLYCGSVDQLTIDHVVPLAKGGAHEISNLVPACKSCNSSKQDRDLDVFLADRGLPQPAFKEL